MNIYNKFRGVEKVANKFSLSKRFDEPTYFSFRLDFSDRADYVYNIANNYATYDTMPHPLFSLDENRGKNVADVTMYSAIRYLEDANEPVRAEMLRDFISKFNVLQETFPYYFQSIDGISEILKIDPTKGQRITNDKKITVTCLEGLDLRMSYIMNLYKKIVWDDVYQRWVLPDMMRYFALKIYLAEFRTFHLPVLNENTKPNPYGDTVNIVSTENLLGTTINKDSLITPNLQTNVKVSSDTPVYLKILDDVLPTWEITCEMCEFDINDITFDHTTNLNVATDPIQGAVRFGVKIGNIKELQIYPVFEHKFLSDRKLNGVNRTGRRAVVVPATTYEEGRIDSQEEISTKEDANNKYQYPASLQIAQNRYSNESEHIAGGRPYNERANENTTDNMKGIYPSNPPDSLSEATDDESNVRADSNSWVGNAINFGSAYAENFVKKYVDKAKVMTIPNLGVSYTEVMAALSAKDIVGAFGMIRKGVNEVVNQYGNAPSSRLEQPLQTDVIMKDFLTTMSKMSKSDATDQTTIALIEAANIVLSENGVWEKIKDYSLATNLEGINETNIKKDLQNSQQYKSISDQQASLSSISGNLSNDMGIPEVMPNAASNKTSINDSTITQILASIDLDDKINGDAINIGTASSNLSNLLDSNKISSTTASSRLASDIKSDYSLNVKPSQELLNDNLKQNLKSTEVVSNRLSQTIDDKSLQNKSQTSEKLSGIIKESLTTTVASSNLSSTISESAINTNVKKTTIIDTNTKINQPTPGIKTKTIQMTQVIEAQPSRIMINKMESENLKQPPVSKATTNKIEEQKLEIGSESKATNSKLQSSEKINDIEPGQATNQELFSK